jgi:pyruvate formate lyase activating enzyme
MTHSKGVVKARYWHGLDEEGRVQCDLCPRYCRPRPGQRGLCYVRENRGGAMVLTTYGRSSGFCVDPIEKKPLNHFYPGTSVLSFGTAGCNLTCSFCQNWSISKSRQADTLAASAGPEAIAARAAELGCRSVAYTYNDPVIFLEYAVDVAAACRKLGVRNVAVTAGYITAEARPEFFGSMDAANIDLKAFSESFYQRHCTAELEPVKETLRYLSRETEVWFEVTVLLIPGENDGDDELRRMADWLVAEVGPGVPLHFSAFHPDFRMQDKARTPSSTLRRAREHARAAGVQHVYVGNVFDKAASSTYCGSCSALLIEREWYELGDYRITAGACPDCGASVPGRFDTTPGTWGRKRLPVVFR